MSYFPVRTDPCVVASSKTARSGPPWKRYPAPRPRSICANPAARVFHTKCGPELPPDGVEPLALWDGCGAGARCRYPAPNGTEVPERNVGARYPTPARAPTHEAHSLTAGRPNVTALPIVRWRGTHPLPTAPEQSGSGDWLTHWRLT